MAKQTELELTAQQAAQPEETPAKKTAAKKTAAQKPAAKKATTKKTTTKTKAAKAENGESAAKKPAAKRTTKKTEAKPGTKLVIVESPAKAKTIGKYLGRGYTVTASMGHIRDLPASTLGIDVEHGYTPKYITIKGKNALVKDLKAEAKKAQTVYLATDPDREGEAISWHLANVLGLDPTAPNRVTFDEITKKGVQEGMAHPRTIDMDLFNAQQARRALDRLVGYKLSPFLWHKVRRGLSAGRVQSVAVRIIRDREIEIENFKPEEYWNIDANLKPRQSGCAFNARLTAQADGTKLVVAMLMGTFRGGSFGAAEGYKFVEAAARAAKKRYPFLAYVHGTAGIRIQEGTHGVIQMPRCTVAVRRYIESGGLYLVLYDTNSFAGPVASFLGCAPYQFAVRSSNIGFAGPGVIKETTGMDIPPKYHRSYRALSRGHIQGIWDRRQIRANLKQALLTMGGRNLYYR